MVGRRFVHGLLSPASFLFPPSSLCLPIHDTYLFLYALSSSVMKHISISVWPAGTTLITILCLCSLSSSCFSCFQSSPYRMIRSILPQDVSLCMHCYVTHITRQILHKDIVLRGSIQCTMQYACVSVDCLSCPYKYHTSTSNVP